MYRKLFFFLAAIICCLGTYAQTASCAFEDLFTIRPGMGKPAVVDTINNTYKVTLVKTESETKPPYASSGGDSILVETLTYKTDGVARTCFHGANSILRLDFADNKLFKAYIGTEYAQALYPDLMGNFTLLRKSIKKSWKFEKEVKVSGSNVEGFGYSYTKTDKKTNKPETCTLQYVKIKGNTPSADKYLLEVIWANLQNTRMEASAY